MKIFSKYDDIILLQFFRLILTTYLLQYSFTLKIFFQSIPLPEEKFASQWLDWKFRNGRRFKLGLGKSKLNF